MNASKIEALSRTIQKLQSELTILEQADPSIAASGHVPGIGERCVRIEDKQAVRACLMLEIDSRKIWLKAHEQELRDEVNGKDAEKGGGQSC